MAITTDRDKVRLEIGDTDVDPDTDALFSDEEIDYFLDTYGSVLKAAAAACDALARKFARAYDFSTDGQSFSRGQMAKAYAQLAKELRARANGIETHATTKVDGYSDDIPFDQASGSSNRYGRVRAGWTDPDLPL